MKVSFFQPLSIYHQGKREMQEDAIFPADGQASELDNLFIVCDGMGGHDKGEVASATVIEAISDYFFQNTSPEEQLDDEVLQGAIQYAYDKLLEKVDANVEKKPGTTLCLLYFHRGGCTAAHIGDSRIYHIRPEERKICYKSRDHSLVYELYTLGEINEEQMLTHPRKNIITKVIMPGTNSLKADVAHIADIRSGDYFYVCSDGMLEKMLDRDIIDIFANGSTTNEQKRELLLEKTKDNADNHSAYIIQIDGVMHEQRDKNIVDDEEEMMKKALPGAFAPIDKDVADAPTATAPPHAATTTHAADNAAESTTPPRPTADATRTSHTTATSHTYREPEHPAATAKKRSLIIPIITTLVLLGALAFVLFKCAGNKQTIEDNPQTVQDSVQPKKPERDTFNIMGGSEAKRSSDMPQPSGEKKADEQKPTEKKDEKKPEQGKPEGDGGNPTQETAGSTTTPSQTPTTTTPSGQTTTPTTRQNPTPAVQTPPQTTQQPATPPPSDGPKPVIPDGE